MAICCCSLAGTAACKHCNNYPDGEPLKTYTTYYINPEEYEPTSSSNRHLLMDMLKECKITETERYCRYCGNKINPWYNFCPNCGAKNYDKT